MTRKGIFFIVAFLLLALISHGQDFTYEQQQRLQQYFDTNSKLYGVSQNILESVLSDHKDFFGNYADALAAVDILNKIANAQDAQALESALLVVEGKMVSKLIPGLGSVLGWAAAVKTGMDLMINFVINPALISNATSTYYNNREAGFEQDEAVINIRAWGNIEQQLMAQFRTQYGDNVFKEIKPSGLILLPRWKPKFDEYILFWFENQYQNKKLKEFQEIARKMLKSQSQSNKDQEALIELWIAEMMKEVDFITISPGSEILNINESVTFVVSAVDKSKNKLTVTDQALSTPTFTATKQGIFTITANYKGHSASAVITVAGSTNCLPTEVWDDILETCICKEGFEKNDQDECVKVTVEDVEDISCPDPNAERVWDANTENYYCACKNNFKKDPNSGLCVRDITSMLSSADCANDPYASANWDPVNEIVICNCIDNYTWDNAQKKCVPDIQMIIANSDCSQWPNTEVKWDYSSQKPYCDCVAGFQWNEDYTICISDQEVLVAQSDCSQYPNSQPVWDPGNQEVVCDCLPGFVWNDEYTACISETQDAVQNMDCSNYPNTQSVWDPLSQQAYCDCLAGYEWNADFSACEEIQQQQVQYDCSHIPNSRPVYDNVNDIVVCDCMPGYEWNRSQTNCVPVRRQPTVNWNDILTMTMGILDAAGAGGQNMLPGFPQGYGTGAGGGTASNQEEAVVHQSNCNDQQQSGGNAPEVHMIDLGQSFGSFILDYNVYDVKDQIIVSQSGRVIYDSHCVSGSNSVRINLSGFSSQISVRVNPNCDGTSGTQWTFTVHCPDQ